ncbi:MAG: hypothetical protein Q8L60_04735 [Gammaproteobacteria bacterium]|nr:hypothetical protein [Gammaproteobacteria bacterium]MDP2140704.1 hypothetical protein [Gammaproteobacteria bacterium]MDP2346960.1 hypothetical protein [Gammaproteobacteria bacterium]
MMEKLRSERALNQKKLVVTSCISAFNMTLIALGAVSLATANSGQGLHPILELPTVYYSLIAIGVLSEAIILPQIVRILAQRRQLETEIRKANDKTGEIR